MGSHHSPDTRRLAGPECVLQAVAPHTLGYRKDQSKTDELVSPRFQTSSVLPQVLLLLHHLLLATNIFKDTLFHSILVVVFSLGGCHYQYRSFSCGVVRLRRMMFQIEEEPFQRCQKHPLRS
jgi:hypothetical protein